MSDNQAGYVVCYDTQGGGIVSPSWGLYVCWGEDELAEEVTRVLNEIEDDGYTTDDIVILRIDESFNFSVKRETKTVEEVTVSLTRKENT